MFIKLVVLTLKMDQVFASDSQHGSSDWIFKHDLPNIDVLTIGEHVKDDCFNCFSYHVCVQVSFCVIFVYLVLFQV